MSNGILERIEAKLDLLLQQLDETGAEEVREIFKEPKSKPKPKPSKLSRAEIAYQLNTMVKPKADQVREELGLRKLNALLENHEIETVADLHPSEYESFMQDCDEALALSE